MHLIIDLLVLPQLKIDILFVQGSDRERIQAAQHPGPAATSHRSGRRGSHGSSADKPEPGNPKSGKRAFHRVRGQWDSWESYARARLDILHQGQ